MTITFFSEPEGDNETIDLLPGNQYILRYLAVSSLLKSGAVKLI